MLIFVIIYHIIVVIKITMYRIKFNFKILNFFYKYLKNRISKLESRINR